MSDNAVKEKWRPTLGMIIFAVLTTVMLLPLVGLFFFRLYENQLVRQTESELIAQGAVLSALFASEVNAALPSGLQLGSPVPEAELPDPGEPFHPIVPSLDLASDNMKGRRPDVQLPAKPPTDKYLEIGSRLSSLALEAQKVTLAGFRILDPFGNVIGGKLETGLSLAHVEEVTVALKGRYSSVLRVRVSDEPPPPLYSISRGTGVRVFVAMPVIVDRKVAGVIYASRTPSNVVKHLYHERRKVLLAALTVFGVTLLIGLVFYRTITRPIYELIRRTSEIGYGNRDSIYPPKHHGSREIALLSQSFLKMAERLVDRSEYISNFAAHVSHELKSPLTSIQGAAELLRHSGATMTDEERKKFLENISADSQRLTSLVQRLLELARADNPQTGGMTDIEKVTDGLKKVFPQMRFRVIGDKNLVLDMSLENALIVFRHLADNSVRHNASEIEIHLVKKDDGAEIQFGDNGDGISEKNAEKIFETFFTTRRESGGTGMGLGIVQSLLAAHQGSIELIQAQPSAKFKIRFGREMRD